MQHTCTTHAHQQNEKCDSKNEAHIQLAGIITKYGNTKRTYTS